MIPITNDESNVYIVQSGDTLYAIANNNNISVDELKKINNLKSNLLSIGQKLIIPKTEAKEIEYVVKSGDSLWKIARLYNTTVNDIKKFNNLTSDLLKIGQVLKLVI